MANPGVSVLLPVFNGERYLDEAVRSILDQTGVDLELVIIDDASTDATPALLRRWEELDARVRIVRLTENGGAGAALNAGLAVAGGTYIARQDADDTSRPGRLAAQAALLDRDPDLVLVGTNYALIDETGRVTGVADHVETSSVLAFLLNFSNALGVPGQGMFRTDVARAVGGYSPDFRFAQGYELWIRLAMRGRVSVLPIVGIEYRVHSQSVTRMRTREQAAMAIEVSRRMLSITTGRTVTREEAEAVYGRWHGFTPDTVSSLANAVIREAFEAYLHTNPSSADRDRIRAVIATRFARSAVRLARRGRIGESAVCARFASSWHPSGVAGVARHGLARVARAVARRRVTS